MQNTHKQNNDYKYQKSNKKSYSIRQNTTGDFTIEEIKPTPATGAVD